MFIYLHICFGSSSSGGSLDTSCLDNRCGFLDTAFRSVQSRAVQDLNVLDGTGISFDELPNAKLTIMGGTGAYVDIVGSGKTRRKSLTEQLSFTTLSTRFPPKNQLYVDHRLD